MNGKKPLAYVGGLSADGMADKLRGGVGLWGLVADYIYNTMAQLEDFGSHPSNIWKMQALAAVRMELLW